jgi:hypothetical protein
MPFNLLYSILLVVLLSSNFALHLKYLAILRLIDSKLTHVLDDVNVIKYAWLQCYIPWQSTCKYKTKVSI